MPQNHNICILQKMQFVKTHEVFILFSFFVELKNFDNIMSMEIVPIIIEVFQR